MRFSRFVRLMVLLPLCSAVWSPQTAAQQGTQPTPAPRDVQAVNVVNQALNVAGGLAAILAVNDYTASGNISYHQGQNQDVQGSVIMSGLGLNEFRLDATLQAGVRSFAVNSEGQTAGKNENGDVWRKQFPIPMITGTFALPSRELAVAFVNPYFSLSFKGLVEVDGQSLYDVQVQRELPGQFDPNGLIAKYHTVDFFIDALTLRVVMLQDVVPKDLPRQIRYSDFRLLNGVLSPFSIEERINTQPFLTINLNQIGFNVGLQDSSFEL